MSQTVKRVPAVHQTQVRSLGREDPLEREMATHSSIFAMDGGASQATVHGVAKSQTRLSDFIFLSLLCARHSAKVYTYMWP